MFLSPSRKHLAAYELSAKNVKIIEKNEVLNALITSILYRATRTPLIISFLNAHALNLAMKSESFFMTLKSSNFLFRDGSGMRLLYSALKLEAGLNLNGTDLIPKILSSSKQEKFHLYLIGTNTKNLQLACSKLIEAGFPTIALADGFREFEHYLKIIPKTSTENRIFLLGMGMPKQEEFSIILKNHINSGLIVNGGAFIDFQSGEISRAPQLFRTLGIEWLFRLYSEPRRLFSRYVFGNTEFLLRIPFILKAKKTQENI